MPSKDCKIINKLGLHARAASKLVDVASRYSANIQLHKDQSSADAKSIMDLMMLAATCGTPITLTAEGEDAAQALQAVYTLINERFGEVE